VVPRDAPLERIIRRAGAHTRPRTSARSSKTKDAPGSAPQRGIHKRRELLERGIFGPPVAPLLSRGKGLGTRKRKERNRSREERGRRRRRLPNHPARKERSIRREMCTLLSIKRQAGGSPPNCII
jgi:hypothetical protein